MARIIRVVVSPKGEITVETKGYTGSECQQASKFIEQALGVVTSEKMTAEYYAEEKIEQHLQQ